jgi:hypothetical protein
VHFVRLDDRKWKITEGKQMISKETVRYDDDHDSVMFTDSTLRSKRAATGVITLPFVL